jgi:hypothetical protein
MNFNQWAQQLNVGTRYERPIPSPNCHYFDTKVFKQSLTKHKNKSIMRTLKKILGLAIIISVMASCNRYTGTSNGKGCGVWMPKKYSGKAPKMRGNAHMVSF